MRRQRTAIAEAVIENFCRLYQENWSVRKLAVRFELPRSTVHYWILKRLGRGAERRDTKAGLLPIIEEHFEGLPDRHRAEVWRWMQQNQEAIQAADRAHTGTRLLTTWEERGLGQQETYGGRDFRYVLDEIRWRDDDAA